MFDNAIKWNEKKLINNGKVFDLKILLVEWMILRYYFQKTFGNIIHGNMSFLDNLLLQTHCFRQIHGPKNVLQNMGQKKTTK